MSAFEICTGCTRHVRQSDTACPFCGTRTTTARASLPSWVRALVAGSVLVGVACDSDKAKPTPPAKSDTKASAKPDAVEPDAGEPDAGEPDAVEPDESGAAKPANANADGANANDTGGQDTSADAIPRDTSQPVDDGATADPDTPPEPKRKPKYGLARPKPRPMPRPATKYGGPPRPEFDPVPEPPPKPPAK